MANMNALPDELLLEVLSHLPPGPITSSRASEVQINRRETLLSLSVVCHNLRRFFRPYLWQRVEVCVGMRVGQYSWRGITKELLRQLHVVTTQNPDLAQYVRIVDIQVNDATVRRVFVRLGRCLSLFPNLHTVKIVFMGIQDETITAAAKHGFKKTVSYPQIRSAILSPSLYPLIAACPNLESLTTWNTVMGCHLGTLTKGLTALLQRRCFFFRIIVPAPKAIRVLPSLRRIMLLDFNPWYEYETLIKIIRLFPNISTLVLHREGSWGRTPQTIVSWKLGLRKLPPHDRQNLREVIFLGYGGETSFVLSEV